GGGSADEDGHRRVPVVSLPDASHVELQHVAWYQSPLPGDAVDDLLVEGRADRAGKASVALEGGHGAFLPDDPLSQPVQVHRRHAGPNRLDQPLDRERDDPARLAHALDLLRGLEDDQPTLAPSSVLSVDVAYRPQRAPRHL